MCSDNLDEEDIIKFVLTLHCETDWNVKGILQGHIDRELHAVGIAHAHGKGSLLLESNHHIAGIVSSDLKRGIQTAEIINEYLHVPHAINPGLRECGYGSLEGLEKSTIGATSIWVEGKYLSGWDDPFESYDYRKIGGESYEEVIQRQRKVFDELVARYDAHDMLLVVGHGTSMNSLLHALGHRDLPMNRREIRVIEY